MGSPRIICDTRQKASKHINIDSWFDAHGIDYEYRKVDFGDYIRADGFSNISIDTKQDIAEVVGNIGHDHARFVRECDRARDAGWRLIILVEQHPEYNDRARLRTWVSGVCGRCPHKRAGECDPRKIKGRKCLRGRKPMQGSDVADIIAGIERNHGCIFEFCNKRHTARIICEKLGIEYE